MAVSVQALLSWLSRAWFQRTMILRMGQEKIAALGIGDPDHTVSVSSALLPGESVEMQIFSKYIDLQDEVRHEFNSSDCLSPGYSFLYGLSVCCSEK